MLWIKLEVWPRFYPLNQFKKFYFIGGIILFNQDNFALQLRQRKEYTQLVNAINRDLIEKHPNTIGTMGGRTYVAAGTAAGAAGGGVVAAYGVAIIFGGPVTWGAVAVGAGIGALLGGYLSNRYVENVRREVTTIETELEEIVNKVYQIHETFAQNPQDRPNELIQDFRNRLVKMRYVESTPDNKRHTKFCFRRDRFKEISRYYNTEEGARIVDSIKFIILMSFAALPAADRPMDRIIAELEPLTRRLDDPGFKNAGRFTLGLLYTDRCNDARATEWFHLVDQNSECYPVAQAAIRRISNVQ